MGYGRHAPSRRSFSRRPGPPDPRSTRVPSHLTQTPPGFAWGTGRVLGPGKPPPGPAALPCHSCAHLPGLRSPHRHDHHPEGRITRRGGLVLALSVISVASRYGNINPFIHSTTPVGLALGPDSPRDDERGPGTLGHPADGIFTRLSLLMSAFSLPRSPRQAHAAASPLGGRSPTQWQNHHCRVFGGVLEPRYIVGAEPLDQ